MSEIGSSSPLSSLGSRLGMPAEAESGIASDSLGHSSAREARVPTLRVRKTARCDELLDCVRLCIFNVGSTTVAEAWSELFDMMPWSEYQQIVKLQRVVNASTHPRIDMWVRGDLGAALVRELREMTRHRTPSFVRSLERTARLLDYRSKVCSGWRFAVWQSWRDRRSHSDPQPTRKVKMAFPGGIRLATLNINGFPSKREQVSEFLSKERIAVCALQETLVSVSQYPVRVPGYRTYARDWQEGFRGQAVLVLADLPSYEVPHVKERLEGYKYLLHVKIASIPGIPGPPRSLHFIGVYLPSGGNMRAKRTAGFKALTHLYDGIMRNEHGALVAAMGDYNAPPLVCQKRMGGSSLSHHQPVGSSVSRFPLRGPPASLDHLLVSPVAKVFCKRPRVYRNWAMSDHRPLVSTLWTHIPHSEGGAPSTAVRYDRRKLARYSFELVNDNRWLALEDLEATDHASLSDLASALSGTLETVSSDTGIRVDSGSSTAEPYFPRRLKNILNRYREESSAVADFLQYGRKVGDIALQRYLSAKANYKRELKAWRRREKSKHYAQIAMDFVVHDHRNVWSRLRSQIDTRERGDVPMPVRNKAGSLCVDSDSHLAAVKEHYQSLAQDDPDGTSRDENYWDSISLSYPRTEETLGGLNAPLQWKEVVVAIRGMNRDTAPGVDKMHINLLKAMVKEECMLEVYGPDKEKHPDLSVRALPEKKIPNSPLSPMGKALWKVLNAVWSLEDIPDGWSEVVIVNLFKKGDPELLVNYRGLSLISVSLKIIMVVMVHRLEKHIDDKLVAMSRSQSGFRRREEAIAQFLVMAEIVRRRHLNGKPTLGLFIDLVKAYDRVPHGALYRVLDHRGIRGKFLNIIKSMYKSSKMRVRACGKLAEPFDMWRGLRQGCPLSPLLFIIFIDHFLVDTRPSGPGLDIPASLQRAPREGQAATPARSCFNMDGGMYADDVVCFEESIEATRLRCMNIVKWGEKWGMHCNFAKSGVLLWSYDEGLRAAYNDTSFVTSMGTFPKVSSYKYLGIEVSENLPLFMGGDSANLLQGRSTDALLHAKSLAAKGLTALTTLKPVLCDPACPLPLKIELIRAFVMSVMAYGAEFIGFNKKLAEPLQRVMNVALRWSVGLKKSSKVTSGLVMSVELGIPLFYEFLAGQRARLFHKLTLGDPPMQTLLPALQEDHTFHPQRTWCSENECWLKRFHAPPLKRKGEWRWGDTGMYKYAPLEMVPNKEVRDSYWEKGVNPRRQEQRTYDHAGLAAMTKEVTKWYLAGAIGDSAWGSEDETYRCWKYKVPDVPYPVRGWYTFARTVELHRRSNKYRSKPLMEYRFLLLGIDDRGLVLRDPHDLTWAELYHRLKALKSNDEVEEVRKVASDFLRDKPSWAAGDLALDRQFQDVAYGGGSSDEGARRLFVREVRECALERLFSVDGGRQASFTDWYDRFQFGATRDFLRITLGRPDLSLGVRWLVLCRIGAFPRVYNARTKSGHLTSRHTCPLCGKHVEIGWDWIHLALQCSDWAVISARKKFLRSPIKYLTVDKVAKSIYEANVSQPKSTVGLPLGSLKTDRLPGIIRLAIAIRLVGGCISDPRESVYLLSFGHLDYILTDLGHYGYVFMASFLQTVAPHYCRALGLNSSQVLDLVSASSKVGSGGATPLGANRNITGSVNLAEAGEALSQRVTSGAEPTSGPAGHDV